MVLKRLPLKASVYLFLELQQRLPFTVLKLSFLFPPNWKIKIATALTVYGIETHLERLNQNQIVQLQQHLPFTVLKPANSQLSNFL